MEVTFRGSPDEFRQAFGGGGSLLGGPFRVAMGPFPVPAEMVEQVFGPDHRPEFGGDAGAVVVQKFRLPTERGTFDMELPKDCRPLHLGWQYGALHMWVEVDVDKAGEYERRRFSLRGSGAQRPAGAEYVDSVHFRGYRDDVEDGDCVRHLYEVPPVAQADDFVSEHDHRSAFRG